MRLLRRLISVTGRLGGKAKCREHGFIYHASCQNCGQARAHRESRERCDTHGLAFECSCRNCRKASKRRDAKLDRKITRGVNLQLGMETLKGLGHFVAAAILIEWLFRAATDGENSLSWEIIVAAAAAAIIFDPVITGTKLVKKWVRTLAHRTDDTDASWEADWPSSKKRRRKDAAQRRGRRWIGATTGSFVGLSFPVLMAVAIYAQQCRSGLLVCEFYIRIADFAVSQPILFILFTILIVVLIAGCGIYGHMIEKSLWPKPDENPMRRDDW